MKPDNVAQMFWNGVQQRGAQVILRQKEFGIWHASTWAELGRAAREVAMGLASLGFEPGETASIQANTNREWLFADLGILCAGGVANGIYPTDAAAQTEFLMADSRSVYLFVEDEEQLDKALEVRDRLPGLRRIIVFDMEGLRDLADPAMSLAELRALGADHDAKHAGEFERRLAARKGAELAILVYTSGTTGKPKGAMISHENILVTVKAYQDAFPQGPGDERMAFLPLCHIAERLGGEYHALYSGAVLNFVENPETVPENVREIAPTVFTAVPRIWEKFYSAVLIRLKEAGALQQWAYSVAIGIGQQVAKLREDGKAVPGGLAAKFWLARMLVLNNIRRVIGVHRARVLITGAAPISPDLVRWYMALGLEMIEVWGQTESCGAITSNIAGRVKPGSIGPRMQHTEVAVSPEGWSLIARGGSIFMGYLNLPEKTAETLKDGWLHTGDVGRVDADGYFYITDRMKDIIITAGGKNITPSEFENQLKFSPYITDAVVIGDRRPYLVARVMIDHENVEMYAQEKAIPFSNYASLCRRPEIQELIQGEIDKVNKGFARAEQVKKFRLIEAKLTAEDEELTPTMKLKRKLVNDKYSDLIESMYAKEAA